nr:MAG TPA: hypothetical protein [Caudoviricetes sp.]
MNIYFRERTNNPLFFHAYIYLILFLKGDCE